MNYAARLIIPGTLIGSILVGFFGYVVTASYSISTVKAASPSPETETVILDQEIKEGDEQEQTNQTLDVSCEVSKQYPKAIYKWCGLITKYARKNHLNPDLIAAMILQESGGNPNAYSSSGAVGLMQIMPRDGIAASFMCSGGACFSSRPTIKQLEDPEFNIKYGTRMIASLVKKQGGTRDALKAYGPMDSGYYYADKVLSIYERYGN